MGGIRIQFTKHDILIAEVIVSDVREADRVSTAYHNRVNCGSIYYRTDLKRLWDVPVGSSVIKTKVS